jgi:hypothetical protein
MSDLINQTLVALENTDKTSNLFTQNLEEAASTSSLGKLAADHYHHHSLHVYGHEADRTSAQIKAHGSNAEKIHSKIATHHGKEVADAVAKHSDDAATVENASVGHVEPHFHSDFVKKHLGGHGSTEHAAYKKQITHHDDDEVAAHQTEKDWNEHA